ncbi:hypothetical protein KUTeg_014386 [Tegillarca granosa]|uniref:THAP-type domain-containing protein n=1 Tax=Tegillarca granosa TaxID=220873 RepID=A0ABQ9EZW4_TEGGR|nr:hypothetical protein KUTeg_014386 [Tegillarca granosa]
MSGGRGIVCVANLDNFDNGLISLPSAYSSLCSDHFTEECFPVKYCIMKSVGQSPQQKRLKLGSVPTILSKTEQASPKRPFTAINHRCPCNETPSVPKETKTAFVKREKRRARLIKNAGHEILHILTNNNTCITDKKEHPVPVSSEEDNYKPNSSVTPYDVKENERSCVTSRNVGCQLSLSRKEYRSHYVQARFIGKNKGTHNFKLTL